ncbi:sugar phosphate isomerase/epimerase [Pedobacter heparinus]|uniref:sugar phosphate isomerase/epimerase n=1 Tax=Pedobacter heparinus TaxID=984 RepID=UPI00292E08A3|nr:sugar phosphate isomerase/epimerase [Pedobacter heparinus]
MDIRFYAPRWGSEQLGWKSFVDLVVKHAYQGVEVFPLQSLSEKTEMLHAIEDQGLDMVLIHAELTEGKNFEAYKNALNRNLYTLAEYQTSRLKPKFINSQTGREYYTEDQMAQCFAICDKISEETGIKIIHETHRNKWSYAAHVVYRYLQQFSSIRLALDISHWVCVSESYLEDQFEAVQTAIAHSDHLHARVGSIEGPQVTDPRAPENSEALQHHLRFWDQWVKQQYENKVRECSITTEFGPHPYMSYKCFSNEPVADQWEINVYMKDLLRQRYQNFQSFL